MAEGSNGSGRQKEPRSACASNESGLFPGHSVQTAPPNFSRLMDDTLNGDNKRKSNQGEEDTEKRYKPVDSRDEMLQVMIAAVEQMRQTQQQTFAVMGELLQHMKSTSSTANTASPATDQLVATHEQQAIAEMMQAVTQAVSHNQMVILRTPQKDRNSVEDLVGEGYGMGVSKTIGKKLPQNGQLYNL